MTAAGGTAKRDRGAALVVVVVLTAAFSVAAGALTLFALLEARVATAARDRLAAASAVEAGLELVTAALAAETDYGAVRAGSSTPPPSGTATHRVRGVLVDVASLSRELERRRAALPAPADTGTWRPYLWGRVTELLGDAEADGAHQPWIVAWVRTEEGSGLGPDRLEVAVEARGTGGARAGAVAVVERRAAGAALLAVWPDARFADD